MPFDLRFVAFLDILGFRKTVEAKDCNVNKVANLLKLYSSMNQSPKDKNGNVIFHSTISFSDFVIRISSDYSVGNWEPYLHGELMDLAIIQREMIKEGYLIRGGITFGQIHYSDESKEMDIAFGPAFNRAYDLESKCSKAPRIIIDPLLMKNRIWPGFSNLVRRDPDGAKYVDYLYEMFRSQEFRPLYPEINGRERIKFIREHKKLILKHLASNENINIRMKYMWLAQYHNSTIKSLMRCGKFKMNRNDLIIDL